MISATQGSFISVGGGSINDTFRIESSNSKCFCKINSASKYPGLFEKEKNGLQFLRKTKTIKMPEVLWCGEFEGKQILILEWIHQGIRTPKFWKNFGEQLSALHLWVPSDGDRQTDTEALFGFHENNYMGALPQINTHQESWVKFFIDYRLAPQLELAASNNLISKKEIELFHSLYKKLDQIFPKEKPCLLHGDLWSGNFLCSQDGDPVLIDPAVYYGHRCMDIGMTKLFGGFDQQFYEAYHYHFPLQKNYEQQTEICNLYPLLIHLNLFGSGYLSSIRGILKGFV